MNKRPKKNMYLSGFQKLNHHKTTAMNDATQQERRLESRQHDHTSTCVCPIRLIVVDEVSSIDSAPKARMLPKSDYSRLASGKFPCTTIYNGIRVGPARLPPTSGAYTPKQEVMLLFCTWQEYGVPGPSSLLHDEGGLKQQLEV